VNNKLLQLFIRQSGRCFYCDGDTWLFGAGESKDAIRKRLGVPLAGNGSKKALRYRRATIEHLHRKVDGGSDKMENLVMACALCNSRRGELPVNIHLAATQDNREGEK